MAHMSSPPLAQPPASFSCLPCAKRKVKCDKEQPCSHCQRRTKDICEYPTAHGTSPRRGRSTTTTTTSVPNIIREQRVRIQELEQALLKSAQGHSDILKAATSLTERDPAPQSTKRSIDGTPRNDQYFPPQAALVTYNEQTAYIESPVWFSWSEARAPGNESRPGTTSRTTGSGYVPALLDALEGNNALLYRRHPAGADVQALWKAFLANVHPLTKIFFDWDKEPTLLLAGIDPASLSISQHTLCFAVYFMAALSMTEDDCTRLSLGTTRPQLIDTFQANVEVALKLASFASSSNLVVLQSLLLYMTAMRNRANPATLFSLLGVAMRTSQRLGLHRDGSRLGLSPMQAEERRRVWWQLQALDISNSQLLGCVSMTLYAEWDTSLPGNLEDSDVTPNLASLPPDRPGLTSISHCMWRYQILFGHRRGRGKESVGTWLPNTQVSSTQKAGFIERARQPLAEKFLQHCEPVNPLHVHIQIGIQNFLIAMHRGVYQPSFTGTKVSDMSQSERDEFLKICVKAMDYYILTETTPSIAKFRWHHESWFQWTALVYILIEVHHRATLPEAADLWLLINKVCELHPKLTTSIDYPQVYAVARLIILAWQHGREALQHESSKPWCVSKLEEALRVTEPEQQDNHNAARLLELESFDFEMIDWTFWETGRAA